MTDPAKLRDTTRRTIIKGVAGSLGVGLMGAASAHERSGDKESGPAGENTWVSEENDTRGETNNADVVGYHALGSAGASNPTREAEAQDPHYGGLTEITTHGDYAYVTMFSSDSPTPGRGMAIVDISDYNRAESREELESAELSVISFLRNNNTAQAMMDVKLSGDGNYAFVSTQPYTALFGGLPQTNSDDPTHAEAADPTPNTDDESASPQPSGILAVDVSDKANPETLGLFTLEGTGSHNGYHHRINGQDYIFAIQDSGNLAGTGEGMYVLRFDRSSGSLDLANYWAYENDLRQGEADARNAYSGGVLGLDPIGQEGGAYIHDMEVQDDPRTGTPVVYLSYWDRGMWVLDASNPENLEPLGHFAMAASHFSSPAPTLVDGKRVAVSSQEISASDTHTGRVYLVDCEGLFEGEAGHNADGPTQLGELDLWEWQNEYQYPDVDNAVEFGPYDFSLSPHNSDFARHVDPDTGEESFWIHQAHYGGGIQYLEVQSGTDDGLVGADNRFQEPDGDTDGDGLSGAAGPHETTDWNLTRQGYARPTYGTPTESRIEGLNYITPFVWGANESNGVTFASDINQGVHAVIHDDIPVGGASPVAGITRADDGSVFTAGQTNRVDISLDFTDRGVLVRDRLPDGWEKIGGEGTADGGHVTFDLAAGESAAYFAEAPGGSGSYTFGPVEVSADGGKTWHTVADTTDTNVVIGQSTAIGAGGVAVGSAGALSTKREALVDRVAELRSGED